MNGPKNTVLSDLAALEKTLTETETVRLRWLRIGVNAVIAVLSIVVLVFAYKASVNFNATLPSAVAVEGAELVEGRYVYKLEDASACPGELLFWDPNVRALRDVNLDITRTVRREGEGYFVPVETTYSTLELLEGDQARLKRYYRVPDNALAGSYTVLNRLVATTERSELTDYFVYFEVVNCSE